MYIAGPVNNCPGSIAQIGIYQANKLAS